MDEVGGPKLQKDNKMDEEITGTAMHKEMDAGSNDTTIRGSSPGSVAGNATSTDWMAAHVLLSKDGACVCGC